MLPTAKTHVVHITQKLEIGGLESFIVELCRKMDTTGFRSTVLCLNGYDERYKTSLEQIGVPVHLIRKKHRYDALFLLRAASFLRSIRADIVHSHGGCFFYSSLIGKLAGVRQLVHTVHGMPLSSGLQARVEEYLSCAMTDRIIAVSDQIAEDLSSRNPHIANKLEVVINGIDTDRFRPVRDDELRAAGRAGFGLPQTARIIGTVGRLEKIKNYPLLLRACAELIHSHGTGAHLALVGSGSEEQALRQLARELGIAERVSFLGMQYDLQQIYPLFDVFVLSSLTEGTSLSLLEAQACGIPALVTDVGGNPRIISNGINGYLCPSGDQAAMAALLDRLFGDDVLMAEMGNAARTRVMEGFDLSGMVKTYQQGYRSHADTVRRQRMERIMASYDTQLP